MVLTIEQIRFVRQRLSEGKSAESIAKEMGMPFSTFRSNLSESGYRVIMETTRRLEPITPVGEAQLAGV